MEFLAGIVVGSAFAPFWMKVWEYVKPRVAGFFADKSSDKLDDK